jgi:hypothetical protein
MRKTIVLTLLLLPFAAGAQTLYKCTDPRGQVTYSNVPCDKQGLKLDRTVTDDRVTTMPLPPVQKPPAKPPAQAADAQKDAKDDDADVRKPAARVKPVAPVIDKLVK